MSDDKQKGPSQVPSAGAKRAEIGEVLSEHFAWLSRMCLFSVRDQNASEDCLQEVMTEIARSYSSFAGGSTVKTWMFTIARRTISRFRKKSWRYRSRQLLGTEHDAAEDEIAASPAEPLIDRKELESALAQLSERQRQAVMLHYIEDLSVEDGAEQMGCSISSFKTHLLRARERLRDLINPPDRDESGADEQGENLRLTER